MKNEKLIREIPIVYRDFFEEPAMSGFNFSQEDEREIISRFNLDSKREEIIYFHDTTFWNTKKRGLCITNLRIIFIDENCRKEVWWSAIEDIDYCKESSTIDFYSDDNIICEIKFSVFHTFEWKTVEGGHIRGAQFAFLLMLSIKNDLDKSESKIQRFLDKYDGLMDSKKYDECIRIAKPWAIKHSTVCLELYFNSFFAYRLSGDDRTAIKVCNEAVAYYDSQKYLNRKLHFNRYYQYLYLRTILSKILGNCDGSSLRRDYLEVMNDAPKEFNFCDGQTYREAAAEQFNECDKEYLATFLEQPYSKRKIFVAVKEYTNLSQDIVSVININDIPSSIHLPTGHPIANQIYIGHPYLKNKYLPFENYELEFVEDRVREFCYIVQSLGAEEVVIEALNSTANRGQRKVNESIDVAGSAKINSGEVSYTNSYSDKLVDEISKSISLNQRYSPSANIKLPTNLVWYNNEPSWQRLHEQRMHGALLQHEERIDLRKSRVINRTEMDSVAADIKALFVSGNIKYNSDLDEMFESQENVTLSIKVKFTPIQQHVETTVKPANVTRKSDNSSPKPATNDNYTAKEMEYIGMLKECLADGISPSDRRLLGRLCKHLGISDQRAAEIETQLSAPSLTEEEKRYLEEFKFCLEDDNRVSARERMMLVKVRRSLGISVERAEEIEDEYEQDFFN